MSRRRLALFALSVSLSHASLGCGGARCGGHERDSVAAAPVLMSFYVLDDDRQVPDDPWTVVFGAEFEDANGDLAAGAAEFYLNTNREPATQPLASVFRQSGLAANQSTGAFWVTLRFAEETVDDGARVTLGMQLLDAATLRSNCYTLDLAFAVTNLGAGILRAWQPLGCRPD